MEAAPPRVGRRVLAEAVGTGLLVAAVIGSGIAAQRLSPDDTGLQLLENAIATGAALTVLILALQPVSAAFNPVITVLERPHQPDHHPQAAWTVAAQLIGGAAGAVLANLMFGPAAVSIATTVRSGPGWLAEVVATAGLVLTIAALSRTGRPQHIGWAVGAYITAAYWFTSSTSFANPAVTLARTLSDTFAGIAPSSVPAVPRRPGRSVARPRPSDSPAPSTRPRRPSHASTQEMADKPSVLFVCVHNAGRSQMAAGYLTPPRRRARSRSAPPAPNRPTASTPSPCKPWRKKASTSPPNNPRSSPPTPSRPPTSSSPWAAATPAPTTPANATKTGFSTTPPDKTSTTSGPSATRSAAASNA